MSTALALNVTSLLPATLSHVLATPSSTELDQLYWRFQSELKQLNDTDAFLSAMPSTGALTYLMRSGNRDYEHPTNAALYNRNLDVAKRLLEADYWDRAIRCTDIMQHMPQGRKDEWNKQIKELSFPAFSLQALYSTLSTLLNERDRFFAERVEGIYRSLSGDHKTNSINPSGFYTKLIINHVHNEGDVNTSMCGVISDFRYVVGMFAKREGSCHWDTSYELVRILLRNSGEWHDLDGGALKMRVYKKGTCHILVHEDIAWQLNEILAILYPRALAAQYRAKPVKASKTYHLSQNLIGFDVINQLSKLKSVYERFTNGRVGGRIQNAVSLEGAVSMDKYLYEKCLVVLRLLGGHEKRWNEIQFDYDATEVIRQVVVSGMVPDSRSHQYYPTPLALGQYMANLLGALRGDRLLEPQAGTGNLASLLVGNVTCVEISPVFCDVLRAKGLYAEQGDFIEWSKTACASGRLFDGILANPPFSLGRALDHITAASTLLDRGGKLVALVPTSTAKEFEKKHLGKVEIFAVTPEQFPGVSIDLSIIRYIA